MYKLIPLFFKDNKKKSILLGKFDSKHRKYTTFYHYYLTKEKPNFVSIKTKDFIAMQPLTNRSPDGFIFHGGRTGSTLLVRMLRAIENVEVFSEIDLITQVINFKDEYTSAENKLFIKNSIAAYLNSVDSKHKCYFKFTSTDTLAFSLIVKLYPEVPVVYLFDSPERILSSQFLRPPRWAFNSVNIAQKNGFKSNNKNKDNDYLSRIKAQSYILNKSFKIILKNKLSSKIKIVSYQDLFSLNVRKLYKHLGLNITENDFSKIEKIKLFDSKNPNQKFSKAKRESSTPKLLQKHFFQPKSLEYNFKKLKILSK